MLQRLADAGLVKGKTVGIDATTLEANAALRSIVRRDTGESDQDFLTQLAQASGIETPTRADLARIDRKRKGSTRRPRLTLSVRSGAFARLQDGLHKIVGRGGWQIVVERRLSGLNGLAILLEVMDAIGAQGQVPIELRTRAGIELPVEVVHHEVSEFPAGHICSRYERQRQTTAQTPTSWPTPVTARAPHAAHV
jgi:hypothetical protein